MYAYGAYPAYGSYPQQPQPQQQQQQYAPPQQQYAQQPQQPMVSSLVSFDPHSDPSPHLSQRARPFRAIFSPRFLLSAVTSPASSLARGVLSGTWCSSLSLSLSHAVVLLSFCRVAVGLLSLRLVLLN